MVVLAAWLIGKPLDAGGEADQWVQYIPLSPVEFRDQQFDHGAYDPSISLWSFAVWLESIRQMRRRQGDVLVLGAPPSLRSYVCVLLVQGSQ